MSIISKFSQEMYYSRKEMNITQAQAAEALGISTRWYSIIENGRCLPSAELTLKIIAFYGINGELLREKEKAFVIVNRMRGRKSDKNSGSASSKTRQVISEKLMGKTAEPSSSTNFPPV
jgi:DNA-binding XRE family transcriptional regulator